MRDPFRSSFDRLTGDVYIGDVGQNTREEIDFQPASSPGGENYGWRVREGSVATPTGQKKWRATPVLKLYSASGGSERTMRTRCGPTCQNTYAFIEQIEQLHSSARSIGPSISISVPPQWQRLV